MICYLADVFTKNRGKIEEWFSECETIVGEDPLYASVDIRNAGFKVAPIDTNIFPAGFNNLCPSYRRETGKLFKQYCARYFPEAKKISILAEEHTRNLHYFESLFQLQNLISEQGYEVRLCSLSSDLVSDKNEFKTAEGNSISLYKARVCGYLLCLSDFTPDIVVVNNDFSGGLPNLIKKIVQPLLPTPLLGWHTRKKSDHFSLYERIAKHFAKIVHIDPWLITGTHLNMHDIDFSDPKSTARLSTKVDIVLSDIRSHYKAHGVKEAPFVFIKNDAGTYGMAVMTATSGDELLHLNKKARQEMKVGKGRRLVTEVIIQEGIPTVDRIKGFVAEPVMYLVGSKVSGGFFRLHEARGERENLNQPGMRFTKMCFHELMGYSTTYHESCTLECLKIIYQAIARLASLAVGFEIKQAKLKLLK